MSPVSERFYHPLPVGHRETIQARVPDVKTAPCSQRDAEHPSDQHVDDPSVGHDQDPDRRTLRCETVEGRLHSVIEPQKALAIGDGIFDVSARDTRMDLGEPFLDLLPRHPLHDAEVSLPEPSDGDDFEADRPVEDLGRFRCPAEVAGVELLKIVSGEPDSEGVRLVPALFGQRAVLETLEEPPRVPHGLAVTYRDELCRCHRLSISQYRTFEKGRSHSWSFST